MRTFYTLEDYFKILGLDPKKNYSVNEIKKAYHERCLLYHPDKNPGDPLANEIFLKVKEAYDIITNPSFAHQKLSKSTELNLVINFTASFEDGFFGKDYIFNYNRSAELIDRFKLDMVIDSLKFKLPPGSHGVYQKHFPDKGFCKNNETGDLLVRVKLREHSKFTIQGKNVYTEISFPLSFFIKGAKVEVNTLYGPKEVVIKPGTKPGTNLNIPNCGVSKKGYHIINTGLIFPNEEELKKGDWVKLGINWDI